MKTRNPFSLITLVGSAFIAGGIVADDFSSPDVPEAVTAENFLALRRESPFLRSVGLSKSLVLTGVAEIEEDLYATLIDLETRESFLVSEESNQDGWQLVEVKGDKGDLESLTARIKVAGNEVVAIRYEKIPTKSSRSQRHSGGGSSGSRDPRVLSSGQLADAKKGARNYKEGFAADGYRDKPPAATVEKLRKLSVEQREAINKKMFEYRNRGMGSSERVKIYEGMLDRAVNARR